MVFPRAEVLLHNLATETLDGFPAVSVGPIVGGQIGKNRVTNHGAGGSVGTYAFHFFQHERDDVADVLHQLLGVCNRRAECAIGDDGFQAFGTHHGTQAAPSRGPGMRPFAHDVRHRD